MGCARPCQLERIAIDGQPIRNRRDLRQFHIALGELARFRFVLDRDFVARLHVEGGDVDVPAIHLHVAVRNQLASGAAGVRETESENDVVEPRFEKLEQRFTGDTASFVAPFRKSGEIAFPSDRTDNGASAFPRARSRNRIACDASLSGHACRADNFSARAIWKVRRAAHHSGGDFCFGSGVSGHRKVESDWLRVERIRRGVVSADGNRYAEPA